MTWETFPCCCQTQPCPCAGIYSSIVVKWTGSIRYVPLPCKEYWKLWAQDPATGCGFESRIVFPQETTVVTQAFVLPGLNSFSCLSTGVQYETVTMSRFYQSFVPFPGSPDYYDPNFRCQYDTLDNVFGPYQLRFPKFIAVNGPENDPISGVQSRWKVTLSIGSIALRFRSVEQWTCNPDAFEVDPDYPLPNLDYCHGPCSGAANIGGDGCSILNPPPPPFSYPGAQGLAGNTLGHRVELNIGTIQLG